MVHIFNSNGVLTGSSTRLAVSSHEGPTSGHNRLCEASIGRAGGGEHRARGDAGTATVGHRVFVHAVRGRSGFDIDAMRLARRLTGRAVQPCPVTVPISPKTQAPPTDASTSSLAGHLLGHLALALGDGQRRTLGRAPPALSPGGSCTPACDARASHITHTLSPLRERASPSHPHFPPLPPPFPPPCPSSAPLLCPWALAHAGALRNACGAFSLEVSPSSVRGDEWAYSPPTRPHRRPAHE